MEQKGGLGSQIYTTLCTNLLTVAYGASIGWMSPSIPILIGADSPLPSGPVTVAESSLIGSMSCVGGFIASCFYGWLADKYGRKVSLVSLSVPQILSWLLIYYAENTNFLMASRFLSGFAGGGIFIVVPLFISEISEDRVRGRLGSALVFGSNIGVLIAYILGTYLSYSTVPLVLLMITVVFVCGAIVIPDSPLYLMKKSRFQKAEDSLKFYRGYSKDVSDLNQKLRIEFDNLASLVKTSNIDNTRNKLTLGDFLTKPAKRSFIIGMALMFVDIFSGVYAMINYMSTIFAESGSTLSPNVSAMIVAIVQIAGCYCSTLLVDRAGRKVLMAGSSSAVALGLVIFGIFIKLKKYGYDLSAYDWIPLVSFSFVIFIGNFGIISLPFLVMSEVTPQKIRSYVYTFCLMLSWIFAFIISKYLESTIELLGISGVMFIFSINSFCGAVFVLVCVPETKGKSFADILQMLEK
ncbi:unnamed protein product [Diamesa tonsa]